jgi:hypothetical protein
MIGGNEAFIFFLAPLLVIAAVVGIVAFLVNRSRNAR